MTRRIIQVYHLVQSLHVFTTARFSRSQRTAVAYAVLLVASLCPVSAWTSSSSTMSRSLSILRASRRDVTEPTTEVPLKSFWHEHWSFFEDNLPSLSMVPHDFEVLVTDKIRMVTRVAQSDEYRYMRTTHLESSDGSVPSVYTCILYPRATDIPILGMNLMRFQGRRPSVAACDMQPAHVGQRPLADSLMAPLQSSFDRLQQPRTGRRFEVDSPHFSSHTLYSASAGSSTEDDEAMWGQMKKACRQALQLHLPVASKSRHRKEKELLKHHRAYDLHCSTRDVALPVLTRLFGATVADRVVHNVMFPLCAE